MINNFYTKTFTVKRVVWSNDSGAEVYNGTFKGHLQPAGATLAESLGLRFNKTFTIWCNTNTDVEIGDRLNDGSWFYSIHGLENRDYGNNKHLRLIVERDEEYISV